MGTCRLEIEIPEKILYDTKMSRGEALDFARRAVALGYYTQMGVSIGYCAQIAGMAKEDFIRYLGANQVSVFRFDSEEEFRRELENA